MKLADYTKASRAVSQSKDTGLALEEVKTRVREALYKEVSAQRIARLVSLGRRRARSELAALTEQILYKQNIELSSIKERERLIEEILDMVLGLGPIEAMLSDASITEIMVNGPQHVFYEKDGLLHESKERFSSEEQLRCVIDRIVSPLGRRVDEQSPIVNARLPQGHRVNVVIPPLSLSGSILTIRKFRETMFSLEELVACDSLSASAAQVLDWAVRARKNIAVSGGTGGGKTTLLNALSQRIPQQERIITIEDSAELRFDSHPHVVRLEARCANAEGRGAISIRDLVINALRMRPDRIVVGECRGAEALDMLQAMNTGHDGSLTTLHANSPAEVVARLVMMVRYGQDLPTSLIEEQIASALDLIIQQDRLAKGKRRVTQIAVRRARLFSQPNEQTDKAIESAPKDASISRQRSPQTELMFTPVLTWDRRRACYVWHGVPDWIDDLPYMDIATRREVSLWEQSLRAA